MNILSTFPQEYHYPTASFDNLCHAGLNTTIQCDTEYSYENHGQYLYLFVLTMVLIGVGSKPYQVLATTYIDECLPRGKGAVYIGK